MEILYRKLTLEECSRIREIDPSQYIGRAWREAQGRRQLVQIDYSQADFPNGFENHLASLVSTIQTGGSVLGAFYKERLVGYCSANSKCWGETCKYALLDQLFITKELRGKGIGKNLFFRMAGDFAKKGIDKFYICAASAEETIAFYFALGCEEAKEINQKLYQLDTRDLQLEFDFSKLKNRSKL